LTIDYEKQQIYKTNDQLKEHPPKKYKKRNNKFDSKHGSETYKDSNISTFFVAGDKSKV